MSTDNILSRMGRVIAGLANAAVDKAEGASGAAVIEQAIREIDAAADEARTELGKSRAAEFRIRSRRKEIEADLADLDDKIRTALAASREDLAKAGVARQIDLESQIAALDKAMADIALMLDDGQKALQAVLATRREAEARLAEFKRSEAGARSEGEGKPAGFGQSGRAEAGAQQAFATITRLTGVPGTASEGAAELDELDRLHREQAIDARLARLKAGH